MHSAAVAVPGGLHQASLPGPGTPPRAPGTPSLGPATSPPRIRHPPKWAPPREQTPPEQTHPLGADTPQTRHPPPVNRMTNRYINITLPQTSFAGGKNYSAETKYSSTPVTLLKWLPRWKWVNSVYFLCFAR